MNIEINFRKIWLMAFLLLIFQSRADLLYPQNISQMNKQADIYYDKKEFTKAINEWLRILEFEPENEAIHKKIEMVYEEKHKKDLALQRAKLYYRISREKLSEDIKTAKSNSKRAFDYFIISYRIDPQDPELQDMKEDLRKLDSEIKIEEAKSRLSVQLRQEYHNLMKQAALMMETQQFSQAILNYKKALSLVPKDVSALEGIRNAELAIDNRLKYERIHAMIAAGLVLFNQKKYKEARVEFEQVLDLDNRNSEAKRYLKTIDDALEDRRNADLKRIQAEQFYISGIDNLKKRSYDQATEDFENVLSLIENYKDTRERLNSIDKLKKEYDQEQKMLRLKKMNKEFENGLIAFANGKYKEALSYFEKTISLDPQNEFAKKYIVRVKDALKDIEDEVIDRDSSYWDIFNSLSVSGRQLYDKGDYAESKLRWEKILRLFPKNRIALEYLLRCEYKMNPQAFKEFANGIMEEGQQLLKDKKHDKALRKFELIQSISPDYPNLNNLIALAKRGAGKKPVAAGVDMRELNARFAEGMRLYQAGGKDNYIKALEQFKWVIAKDPNNIKAEINMNQIESQLRFGEKGTIPDEKPTLTEKQKQNVRKYYYSGINYYTSNNFDKAIEEWRKVLAIDPNNEKARNNIRKCLALLGR